MQLIERRLGIGRAYCTRSAGSDLFTDITGAVLEFRIELEVTGARNNDISHLDGL